MALTKEQEIRLRQILQAEAQKGRTPFSNERLIDLLLSPTRDADLLALVEREVTTVAQKKQELPAARATQDAAIQREETLLAELKAVVEQGDVSTVAVADAVVVEAKLDESK